MGDFRNTLKRLTKEAKWDATSLSRETRIPRTLLEGWLGQGQDRHLNLLHVDRLALALSARSYEISKNPVDAEDILAELKSAAGFSLAANKPQNRIWDRLRGVESPDQRVLTIGYVDSVLIRGGPGTSVKGLLAEICEEVAWRLSVRLSWLPLRWSEAMTAIQSGTIDLLAGFPITPAALKTCRFSMPLVDKERKVVLEWPVLHFQCPPGGLIDEAREIVHVVEDDPGLCVAMVIAGSAGKARVVGHKYVEEAYAELRSSARQSGGLVISESLMTVGKEPINPCKQFNFRVGLAAHQEEPELLRIVDICLKQSRLGEQEPD